MIQNLLIELPNKEKTKTCTNKYTTAMLFFRFPSFKHCEEIKK